jgi:flagellar hook-length control protein FliK
MSSNEATEFIDGEENFSKKFNEIVSESGGKSDAKSGPASVSQTTNQAQSLRPKKIATADNEGGNDLPPSQQLIDTSIDSGLNTLNQGSIAQSNKLGLLVDGQSENSLVWYDDVSLNNVMSDQLGTILIDETVAGDLASYNTKTLDADVSKELELSSNSLAVSALAPNQAVGVAVAGNLANQFAADLDLNVAQPLASEVSTKSPQAQHLLLNGSIKAVVSQSSTNPLYDSAELAGKFIANQAEFLEQASTLTSEYRPLAGAKFALATAQQQWLMLNKDPLDKLAQHKQIMPVSNVLKLDEMALSIKPPSQGKRTDLPIVLSPRSLHEPVTDTFDVKMDTAVVAGLSTTPSSLSAAGTTPFLPITLHGNKWQNDLTQQITWLRNASIDMAEIELDPKELGPLTIKIAANGSETQVSIQASHSQTRDLFDANQERLRELLQQQGLSLAKFDVGTNQSEQESADWQSDGLENDTAAEAANELVVTDVTSAVTSQLDLFV